MDQGSRVVPPSAGRRAGPARPGDTITRGMLSRLAREAGRYYRIASPQLESGEVAIHGRFDNYRCHSGVGVHATDTLEAHDLSTEFDVEARLTVTVVLEGSLDVDLGGKAGRLGVPAGPTGHIWVFNRPTRVIRRSRKGTRLRKVMISVPPGWVDAAWAGRDLAATALGRFLETHCATFSWQPSNRVLALAEQILNLPERDSPIHRMAVESRAIEIVTAALSHLVAPDGATGQGATPSVRRLCRGQAIRNHVLDHLLDDLHLGAMAADMGMSVESMQRAFKAAYGGTIADFVREQRLLLARDAMDRDGLTVSQAAYLAGYASPANFATAFKKLFGITPSQARQ